MASSPSAMLLSHILGYILYNLSTASPLRGSHLLMTSVQGGVTLGGRDIKGASLVQPFGKWLPPSLRPGLAQGLQKQIRVRARPGGVPAFLEERQTSMGGETDLQGRKARRLP